MYLAHLFLHLIVGIILRDHVLCTEVKLVEGEDALGLVCFLDILNQLFRSVFSHLVVHLVFVLSVHLTFFLILHIDLVLRVLRDASSSGNSGTHMSPMRNIGASLNPTAQRREIKRLFLQEISFI